MAPRRVVVVGGPLDVTNAGDRLPIAVVEAGLATPTGPVFTTDVTFGPLRGYTGSAATAPDNGPP